MLQRRRVKTYHCFSLIFFSPGFCLIVNWISQWQHGARDGDYQKCLLHSIDNKNSWSAIFVFYRGWSQSTVKKTNLRGGGECVSLRLIAINLDRKQKLLISYSCCLLNGGDIFGSPRLWLHVVIELFNWQWSRKRGKKRWGKNGFCFMTFHAVFLLSIIFSDLLMQVDMWCKFERLSCICPFVLASSNPISISGPM